MFDHISVTVRDLAASKAFYDGALEPLGYGVRAEYPGTIGIGTEEAPAYWLVEGDVVGTAHIAFSAPDRATVDAFHAAALAAGGSDNGGPGIREAYAPTYYAAFVHDPDGHNIEAVCHKPE